MKLSTTKSPSNPRSKSDPTDSWILSDPSESPDVPSATPKRPESEISQASPLPLRIKCLLLIFGTLVALVLIELGFRLFTYEFPEKHAKKDRPVVHFYPEHTETMRDFRYAATKPPNTFRMAIVGDSFTFGTSLHFDDTFSKRLERILNLNRGAPNVEVLNFGIPGFSTAQEVKLVERALMRDSDLVITEVTLNDPELKPLSAAGPEAGFPSKPNLNSLLYRHWKSLAFARTRIWNTQTHWADQKYYKRLFENPQTWYRFRDSLLFMKHRVSEKGKKFGVVIFPLFSHPLDASYPFADIHQQIRTLLDDAKIPYVDLLDAYREMDVRRLQIIPGQDSHPNEIAHRIAAEHIYEWLARDNIIPEPIKVRNKSKKREGLPYRLIRNEVLEVPGMIDTLPEQIEAMSTTQTRVHQNGDNGLGGQTK